MNYKQMNAKQLRKALKKESLAFRKLFKRGSFSGLHIAGKIESIQEAMKRRGLNFKPCDIEIFVEIG